MNSQPRSTSFSTISQPVRRPSVGSRLSFAVSNAERGEEQNGAGIAAQHQIEEEIAKIKRYEVGSLISAPWSTSVMASSD